MTLREVSASSSSFSHHHGFLLHVRGHCLCQAVNFGNFGLRIDPFAHAWTALHCFIASPTSRRLPSHLLRRERRARQCQCSVHIATAVMCTYCCNEPVRRLRALVCITPLRVRCFVPFTSLGRFGPSNPSATTPPRIPASLLVCGVKPH